jgi:hypothetical protein
MNLRFCPSFLLAILLVACQPTQPTFHPPTETPRSTDTPTPTETIIWFPPTDTPTPFPTLAFEVTPTENYRQGIGSLLFSDDFSTGEHWQLGRINRGSVALGKNEITIAITEPRIYTYSVRDQPVLSDFYLEITASPSLCRGLDEYGVLLRVASAGDFFRFSLSCDGQVRLDRVLGGTASSRQPWMMSGSVPPGAPSISTLAVWAMGKEMRFFVNDAHQFTVQDPSILNGKIGVFARSTGEQAVTINFSDLTIWELTD